MQEQSSRQSGKSENTKFSEPVADGVSGAFQAGDSEHRSELGDNTNEANGLTKKRTTEMSSEQPQNPQLTAETTTGNMNANLNAVSLTYWFILEEESLLFNPMPSWEFSIWADSFGGFYEYISDLRN